MKYRYDNQDSKQNSSIYALPNKYGYRLNINHPEIKKLYSRFKKWKGIKDNMPLSDIQRNEFETYVLKLLEEKNPPIK